jgi:hypothetical protein
MSVTTPPQSTQPAARRLDTEEAFRELIQKERAVCSRFFRRKFIAVPVLTNRDEHDSGNHEIDSDYVGLADGDDGPQKAYP